MVKLGNDFGRQQPRDEGRLWWLAEPDLWLLGTAGIVSATIGAFSIIVYTFWYDKMSARWDKMIQDIRARDLGG